MDGWQDRRMDNEMILANSCSDGRRGLSVNLIPRISLLIAD